jgi:FG-GAP-like repeat
MRIAPLMLVLCFLISDSQAQFIPEKSFTLPGGSLGHFLAKGDFNHDGKLDVLLSGTNSTAPQELVVFPGNGAGGFGAPIVTSITGLNSVQIGVAGDLNGDGLPDAVITGTDPIQGITEIGVMLADGTGKFKAPVFTRTSVAGLMALGDFTGDGKVDLAVFGSSLNIFPGKGDGTFGSPVIDSYPGAGCVAVADFNKDGKLDLTTGRDVLLGNGDGTFQSPLTLNAGCDIAAGDFNRDGIPDIVAGGTLYPYGAKVLLGNGDGTFRGTASFPLGYHSGFASGRGFTIAKFSGGNNFDIAVANPPNDNVTMLLGNGDGTFTLGKTFAVSILGVLSGDFNGDDKIDLAVQTRQGFSVLLGKGDGTLTAQTEQTGQLGGAIRLADFNGDGKTDALEFEGNRSATSVLLGNGDGTFGTPISLPANCQSPIGIVADFNGDKKADLAFAEGSGGGVGVCLGNGDGTFQNAVVYDAGVQHGTVLFGDFNHDGKLDLAASDVGGVSILLGNGNGTFKSAIPTGASNFINLATGDFNHDGKLDLAANSNGEIIVLLGNGDGTFQSPITSPNPNGFGPLAAGDLNKDGNLDLVTIGQAAPNGMNILLGNGDGTFKAPTLLKVFGPQTFQIRDVNGDGKLDLIVAAPSFLDVILGKGDGTFQAPKNFAAPQGSISLAAADVNGDGLLDVAFLRHTGSSSSGTLTMYLNQGH